MKTSFESLLLLINPAKIKDNKRNNKTIVSIEKITSIRQFDAFADLMWLIKMEL